MEKPYTEISLFCKDLKAYLFEESVLIYSKKSEKVYGFIKEEAALLLHIDELLASNSVEAVSSLFPNIEQVGIDNIIELLSCREKRGKIAYEADIPLGEFIDDDKERLWYQTDSLAFGIEYPNITIRQYLHEILKHLFVEKPTLKKKVAIDFKKDGKLWIFRLNGISSDKKVNEANLYAALLKTMATMAYQVQNNLISLHAAALSYKGTSIIMPAESESGKTTLTALLLNRDFSLYSDDICTIDRNGYIVPLPFPMNIKEGSWGILEYYFPKLKELETFKRYDNQNIRLLSTASFIQKAPQKANCIISPKYKKGKRTSFEEIGVNAALEIISKAGYQVQKEMGEKKFDAIVKYLISLPAYRLEYSDSEEAISLIVDLLEKKF